jgi:signal transduction histidine kinase
MATTRRRARPTGLRLVRLAGLLFLPLGLVAAAVLITLPQRMNDLALSSAEERARGMAAILASLVEPDLEFEDREHAAQVLSRLAVEADVISAELYAEDGGLFAEWPRDGGRVGAPAPPVRLAPNATSTTLGDEHLVVLSPVRAPGGTRGAVRLRFATARIAERRRANMTAAGVAALVVALVGLIFSLLTGRFIIRRQEAEEALRRSAQSFATLSDSLPVALVLHRDDTILYINPAGEKLLDAAPGAAIVGSSLRAALAGGESQPAVRAGGRLHLEPRELRLAGGKSIAVEATTVPVQFGEADASALVALDVTERKRMQERLLLSDRMASLGTLAAGVAHEINNPLAVVIANVELVRDEIGAHLASCSLAQELDESVAALSDSLDAANRVGRIVKDLKTLSRSDSDENGPVDLEQTIDKSLQMVQGQIKHRAQLVRERGGVPRVRGNESRLVQVLINLLINAAQALPDGRAGENRISVATSLEEGEVVITIRDTGCGIPAAVRERVFDPFFTTKPVGVGTGLGLAIVHNLVQAMEGRIDVDSAEGVGTAFWIRLRPAEEAALAQPAAADAPLTGRRRILVIDDEPAVVSAVVRLLSGAHEVIGVHSALVAFERLARGETYDVVLCDLRMPEMSGFDVAERLGESYPDLRQRLVFMTGDIGDAGASEPGTAPVDPSTIAPVLEKPFSRRDLLRFVELRLRRKSNEGFAA